MDVGVCVWCLYTVLCGELCVLVGLCMEEKGVGGRAG